MANGKRKRPALSLDTAPFKRRRSMSSGAPSSRSTVSLPSSNSSGGYRTPIRARRRGRAPVQPAARRRSTGGNNNQSGVRFKRGRSVRREARKRSVRVPATLRKQVRAVIAADDYKGTFMDIIQPVVVKPVDNLQNVVMACGRKVDNYIGMAFDPTTVLNIASELFNHSPANASQDFGQAGFGNSYNLNSLKITVIDSSITYHMRNNTTNNLTVKFWDISPKSIVPNDMNHFDPVAWINAELIRMSPTGAIGTDGQLNKYNPFGVVMGTIGFNPKMIPSFNQYWSMDETVIEMEPGKSYTHTLPGPKNKVYDYRRYFQAGSVTMNTAQKFTKQTMVCVIGDLQATTTARAGRYTDIIAGSGYGLIIEPRNFYKLRLPEQSGFITQQTPPPVNGSQALTNRRDAFIIKNWTAPQDTAIQRIGDDSEAVGATATS